MTGASFIAGDWGTSNLRLYLCDAQGIALDGRTDHAGGRWVSAVSRRPLADLAPGL